MPPLLRPREPTTITLAPRTATVAAECDVLVVGGGPAGLGAAIGAADAGADVSWSSATRSWAATPPRRW